MVNTRSGDAHHAETSAAAEARGPTDFIPMRDIMISMHQGALSEDEINHRLLYPHVRAARANVTARRTSAAQSAQQQDVRDHAQAAAGLG